jgi:hypothetical protein
MGKDNDVPQPGPARLAKGAGPDEWLEQAKQCRYLPEADMKRLCEIVKECLMEGESCTGIVREWGGLVMRRRASWMPPGSEYETNAPQQNPTFNPYAHPSPYAAISTANSTTFSSFFALLVACPATRLPRLSHRPSHYQVQLTQPISSRLPA